MQYGADAKQVLSDLDGFNTASGMTAHAIQNVKKVNLIVASFNTASGMTAHAIC